MIYVNLNQLDHSPVNVRTNEADKTDVKSLAASIAAHGLLQPLVVTENGDGYYVVAGNRRLAALRSLDYAEGIPVNVIEEGLAREASLAENIIRRNLTPIELYEAIAVLGDEGDTLSQKAIAERFGQSIDYVRKAQRLGRVHPEIRAAYKANEIDDAAIKVYANSTDPEEQLTVYKDVCAAVEGSYRSHSSIAREALGFGDYDAKRMLNEVGEDVYKKAGGKIECDLFGDDKRVSDKPLLSKLYESKIIAEDNQLADELGVERIDDTEGWWRTWPKYRGTDEEEARIAELNDTLEAHEYGEDEIEDEDALEALYDEREALREKRKMVLPDDGKTYAVYKGDLYEKKVEDHDEDFEVPSDDCEPPAEEGMALTQKAEQWLKEARQQRRVATLAGGAAGFEAERFSFCVLRCAFRHHLKGGSWLSLEGQMQQADWLIESDDEAAWELFLQANPDERAAVLHGSIGNLIVVGQENPLVQSWVEDCPQPKWESDPEFWALFRKKEQLLQMIEEFAPRWAEAWGECKLKDIQERAHAMCTGEITVPGVTDEEKEAAAAWVPEWLRFTEDEKELEDA